MERRQQFGRRAGAGRETPRARAVARTDPPHDPTEILKPAAEHLDMFAADTDVDREVEEWNKLRKLKKRSFREPWRSFAIATAIAFGAGDLFLPDSVSDITNWLTTGLFAVSVVVGWRQKRD